MLDNNSVTEDNGLTIQVSNKLKNFISPTGKILEYILPETTKWSSLDKFVGKTPILKCNNLATYLSCERLFVKFEGSNPTGTHKDRIAMALVHHAKISGYDEIVAASCGNFGVSLAYFGTILGIQIHIFLPQNYHVPKDRYDRMTHYGAMIHYAVGSYEDAVDLSKRFAEEYGFFDANPGSDISTHISVRAYSKIASEINFGLRRTPDYVICPVGNGTTIAGVYYGYQQMFEHGKSEKIPKIIASSTSRGNPIVHSFKLGNRIISDLDPSRIKETKINEPLINWHSFDGQLALDSIYESNGYAEYANDLEMIKISKLLLREEGINVLPASASSLAVIPKLNYSSNGLFRRKNNRLQGNVVSIVTGRGV